MNFRHLSPATVGLLVASSLALSSAQAHADPRAEAQLRELEAEAGVKQGTLDAGLVAVPLATKALYADVTTLLFFNSLSVQAEWRPLRALSVSAGVGAFAVANVFRSCFDCSNTRLFDLKGVAGELLVHGLFGGVSDHSFEVALGVSAGATVSDASSVVALPAGFLGYRYQPLGGGLMFRSGLALHMAATPGIDLSLGYAF